MTDVPTPPAPAPQPAAIPPKPASVSVPKAGHRITDPGDPSPLGHPEGSDFEPKAAEFHPLTVVLPGTGVPS